MVVYLDCCLLHSDVPAKGPTAGDPATEDRFSKAMPDTTLPSPPALQKLHNLQIHSSNFQDQLFNAFYGKEYSECVRDLEGDDLTWPVNYLDRVRLCLPPWIYTQARAGSQRPSTLLCHFPEVSPRAQEHMRQ